MKTTSRLLMTGLVLSGCGLPSSGAEREQTGSPADHLPPHIRQLTWFGERGDWSHDGRRILFISKTFGDAMEIEVATGHIRDLTAHDPHHGYTRALYLPFSDYPGYKASNPVVSDDGNFIAFQMAKSTEAGGVGHGLFVYDIQKASQR